jgi:hypothetical protein
MIFLENNKWFAGMIIALAGIPIALYGKPWFNEITAIMAGLFLF